MNFKEELEARVRSAEAAITAWLPKEKDLPGDLVEAMNYSVLAGGKRVRPVLMGECYRLFGGTGEEIAPFQTAMELIHTASLVHDDLPAIDNDMFRRGKKTTHAQFGEPQGILAGDALLNYAYEVLLAGISLAAEPGRAIRAARILAGKSGYLGMLGGQSVDVQNEKKGIEGDARQVLDYVYEKKTAALLEASLMTGAALAGAPEEKLDVLEQIGRRIGLAFQIQDDILDVTSTTEVLGKPVFSDEKNQKETYVTLLGLEASAEKVQTFTREAADMLDALNVDTAFLKEMLLYLALRKK